MEVAGKDHTSTVALAPQVAGDDAAGVPLLYNRSRQIYIKCLLCCAIILNGTFYTHSMKVLYNTEVVDWNGEPKIFSKPVFVSLLMPSGMALVGVLDALLCWVKPPVAKETGKSASLPGLRLREMLMLAGLAIFDLTEFLFSAFGYQCLPAGIWQMFRSLDIVSTFLLSLLLLRRLGERRHWVGVSLATLGVMVGGLSTVLNDKAKEEAPSLMHRSVVGMLLVLIGRIFNGMRDCTEEFLTVDQSMRPLKVVGMVGAFMLMVMIGLVIPLAHVIQGDDQGSLENTQETLLMLVSTSSESWLRTKVTTHLSATQNAMCQGIRSACIYFLGVLVHSVVTASYGEAWAQYSYLMVIGLVIMIPGHLIFAGVF